MDITNRKSNNKMNKINKLIKMYEFIGNIH